MSGLFSSLAGIMTSSSSCKESANMITILYKGKHTCVELTFALNVPSLDAEATASEAGALRSSSLALLVAAAASLVVFERSLNASDAPPLPPPQTTNEALSATRNDADFSRASLIALLLSPPTPLPPPPTSRVTALCTLSAGEICVAPARAHIAEKQFASSPLVLTSIELLLLLAIAAIAPLLCGCDVGTLRAAPLSSELSTTNVTSAPDFGESKRRGESANLTDALH